MSLPSPVAAATTLSEGGRVGSDGVAAGVADAPDDGAAEGVGAGVVEAVVGAGAAIFHCAA